jgi:sugar fermentation stimulation protein A
MIEARLVRRYKRFLADVLLADGTQTTVHCPNTGAMQGCREPGARVWLSRAENPARKYPLTWELVEAKPGVLVGIHTGRTNSLVREAIGHGLVSEWGQPRAVRAEVRYGAENSRVDFVLEGEAGPRFVEVKNVTAAVEGGVAVFPDAVSSRGSRHLRELMGVYRGGADAALVFCVQRSDVNEVRPADSIDPVYGQTLRAAIELGVDVIALRAKVTPQRIEIDARVPVVCP